MRLETVSRHLKQLEGMEIISRIDARRICVSNVKALAAAAGPDLTP